MKTTMRRICAAAAKAAVALAVVFCAATPASAATKKGWKGSGDRYWTTDGNWANISANADGYFLRNGEGTTLDDTKRTIRFNKSTSISIKVSVESAGTSASNPYSFLADGDGYGLTTSVNFDVGTWKVGHLAIKRGTYQCNQLNVGGGTGTGDLLVVGGSDNNATLTATGKVAINKETVRVKAKGKLICNNWAAAGNTDNNTGRLVIDGGEVQHTANHLTIGDTANATGYVAVRNGGKYSNTGSHANGLCVGQKGVGTLEVDGGTIDIGTKAFRLCDNTNGKATVTVNNGGTVIMGSVTYGSGSGGATITIDGGTIKAAQSSTEFIPEIAKLNVYIGDSGATFDTAGHTVTIGENLQNASGKTGSARFIGGGVATLAAAPGYTGATTIEVGTILHVPSPGGIGGGLAVEAPSETPENGQYALVVCDGEGVFTDAVLDGVAAPEGATLSISADGKTVLCKYGDGGPVWVGGTSGSLSDAANWANNAVPGPGTNCIIGVSADATLTVGDAFAASSITFPLDSAAVTINASGSESIAGIAAITNLSTTVSHTFNVPVHFAGDIQVKQDAMAETDDLAKAHVTFAGGAYAAPGHALENGDLAAVYSRCIFGKYYFASTAENRWSVRYQGNGKRICLGGGSSLYVPYAGQLNELYVETGAKVYVGDMDLDGRFLYKNFGEVTVTNMTVTGSADIYMSYNQGTATPGVFKIESMSNALSGKWFYLADANAVGAHEFYIGAGGMNFTSDTASYCLGNSKGAGNVCIIRPWHSDFAIADGGGEYNVVFAYGATLCTDDEDGTGRTVTIASATRAAYASPVVISGSGTLKVSKPCVNDAEPQVSVTGTATLEYAVGASLGTGALSLGAGTTFVVSSADLPVNVASLALPETGTATIQIVGDSALPNDEYALFASASLLPAGFESKINLVLPDGSSAARRLYTTDGGTLRLMLGDGTLPCVWTGAADDGNKMSTPGNWLAGTVPPGGATVFIPSAAGTLENDIDGFTPASVTFGLGDGVVTIGGNAISGVAAITNLSSSTHVINVPVVFEDKISVVQGAMSWEQKSNPSIRFAGGVTGTTFASGTARYLNGSFTLTTGEDWIASTQGSNNRWGIPAGASLATPLATNTSELQIGESGAAGGAFTAGVVRTSARLLCYNYGEYVVTNEFESAFAAEEIHFCGWDGISNGKFKFEKLMLSGGSGSNPIFKLGNANSSTGDTGTQRFYIGKGGLCFADGASQKLRFEAGGAKNNATVRIDPWYGDYTIHTKSASNPTDFTVSTKTYFGTTDESGNACTVTDEGVINSYDVGEIHFDGKGTFIVNAVGAATCPVTVHGGSYTTLAINPGKKLTAGKMTVNDKATLALPETGTVAMAGELALAAGSKLSFTLSAAGQTTLDVTGKTLTLPKEGTVVISVAGKSGKAVRSKTPYTLISGANLTDGDLAKFTLGANPPEWVRGENALVIEDGDLKLYTKNPGFYIMIK